MEFSVRYVVLLLLALIVILVVVVFVAQQSGESRDLVTWLINTIKEMTSMDFGPSGSSGASPPAERPDVGEVLVDVGR
jgi:hypothetical protein